jgi:hypothetical protein
MNLKATEPTSQRRDRLLCQLMSATAPLAYGIGRYHTEDLFAFTPPLTPEAGLLTDHQMPL